MPIHLLFERPLLFRLESLLLHEESFALPHGMDIPERNVCAVGLFAKIFELLLGRWDPKRVLVEHLVASGDTCQGTRQT
jgi:hypothetical protein